MISFILEGAGGSVTLPINPGELIIDRGGDNVIESVVELGEIVIARAPKLASVEIESFFPGVEYYYATDFGNPEGQVKTILSMWQSKKPVRFIVTELFENMEVVIESFSHERKAGEHEDVYYKLKLTEYRAYGAAVLKMEGANNVVKQPQTRETIDKKVPNSSSYQVQKGDSLWSIAKKNAGGGGTWKELYDLNKGVVGANPNAIKQGQVLNLPESWVK